MSLYICDEKEEVVIIMMMIMGRRCEDCGNQAKKECVYMRCRTCCKSKAFQCQTHIKSTWVPSFRRSHHKLQSQTQNPRSLREQQQLLSNSSPSSSGVQIRSTTPRHLPIEMSSVADFRCIKVSSIDDGKEQYAYQTTVNIGGHVFRGILYDQGPDKVRIDHHHHNNNNNNNDNNRNSNNYHQELLLHSTSSYPLMITSPFTDFL